MKVIPTKDYVLVKPYEEDASKIILTTKTKPTFHEVIEVGENVKAVAKGDKVLLTDFGGKHVDIDGVDCVIVKEDAILAKII